MEQQDLDNSFEKLTGYIGLLIIELNQYENQFCVDGGYMDQDIKFDLFNIQKTLRHIQKNLQNPFEILNNEFTLFNFIDCLQNENLTILKFLKEKENTESFYPTGYSYVIKYFCMKKSKVFKDFKNYKKIFENMETYFRLLADYLNFKYYFRYH